MSDNSEMASSTSKMSGSSSKTGMSTTDLESVHVSETDTTDTRSTTTISDNVQQFEDVFYSSAEDTNKNICIPTDENGNIHLISKPSKPLKHNQGSMAYLTKPDRQSNYPKSEFFVMNIFNDISRFFRWRFSNHVQINADDLDEEGHAGIPASTYLSGNCSIPISVLQSLPAKSEIIALEPGYEFRPRVKIVENVTSFEVFCENNECGIVAPIRLRTVRSYRTDLSNFTILVDFARLFVNQHVTNTLESGIKAVDLPTLNESERVLANSLSDAKIGLLSTRVWIFAHCTTPLFKIINDSNNPKLRKLLDELASLALETEESIPEIISEATKFQTFVKEARRVLQAIDTRLESGENSRRKSHNGPLKPGDGLQLKKESVKKNKITSPKPKVRICSTEHGWMDFEDLSIDEQINGLYHLLSIASEGMLHATKQIKFLVDDIVETIKDFSFPEQRDFLCLLGHIYDMIQNIIRQPDSTDRERCMARMRKALNDFLKKDFEDFVSVSDHLILKVMEVRDIIQVCLEYVQSHDEIGGPKPGIVPLLPKILFTHRKYDGCCSKICCKFANHRAGSLAEERIPAPHYSPSDFFRVHFEDAFYLPISADIFCFQIRSTDPDGPEIDNPIHSFGVRHSVDDPLHLESSVIHLDSKEDAKKSSGFSVNLTNNASGENTVLLDPNDQQPPTVGSSEEVGTFGTRQGSSDDNQIGDDPPPPRQ